MSGALAESLEEIARDIARVIGHPTPSQRHLLERIKQDAARLRSSTFQLAVLGQFKRGKSTLLNALVGYPLLTTGILPLTAVPTFLSACRRFTLKLTYQNGSRDVREFAGAGDMVMSLATATTEAQNPHNVKGVARVDVGIPSREWLGEITLIDTPGIGSTHVHNTETAVAVLPECDAALFVVSVDPPMTEVEQKYLSEVCRNVSRVIIVLNKVDTVAPAELEQARTFLAFLVAEQAMPNLDPTIFPISARAALAARQANDEAGLRESGVPALEQYLRSALVRHKRAYLEHSIAKKMSGAVTALETEAALSSRALALPLGELDEKIGVFETAVASLLREREAFEDLASGEWRRTIGRLNALCSALEERARRRLDSIVEEVGASANPTSGHARIQAEMNRVFDSEFAAIGSTVDREVADAIEIHRQHYQSLAARVRETAGTLMNVSIPGITPDDWLEIKREPYWIGQARIDNLSSITADALARILPPALRWRRERKRFRESVRDAITRNVSDLRWTMQQNIDDSFRRLLSSAREAVDASIESTREVLAMARERRHSEGTSREQTLKEAEAALARLAVLRGQLESCLHDEPIARQ